jgi:hypothetical protein
LFAISLFGYPANAQSARWLGDEYGKAIDRLLPMPSLADVPGVLRRIDVRWVGGFIPERSIAVAEDREKTITIVWRMPASGSIASWLKDNRSNIASIPMASGRIRGADCRGTRALLDELPQVTLLLAPRSGMANDADMLEVRYQALFVDHRLLIHPMPSEPASLWARKLAALVRRCDPAFEPLDR